MPYPCIHSSGDRNDNEVGELSSGHQGPNPSSPGLLPASNSSHKQNINITAANQVWVGGMVALRLCRNNVKLRDTTLDAL